MLAMFVSPIAAPIKTCRSAGLGIACCAGELGCSKRTPKEQAEIIKSPKPHASIRYSGQWRFSVWIIAANDLERLISIAGREREEVAKGFGSRCAKAVTVRKWLAVCLLLMLFIPQW